jgi:hypothetical protein
MHDNDWPSLEQVKKLKQENTNLRHVCWVLTVYHIIHFAKNTDIGKWLIQNRTIEKFMNTVETGQLIQPMKQLRNKKLDEVALPDELSTRYRELVHKKAKGRHPTTLSDHKGGQENELLFACLDISKTHYVYQDVTDFSIEKNKDLSPGVTVVIQCILDKHEQMGPNNGQVRISEHRLHFKSYVQQFQHNALIGGYMVDDNKHSMAIFPNDGKLQVIDSWNGMIYDLYDLPDKFIITSLTFIYDQNKL